MSHACSPIAISPSVLPLSVCPRRRRSPRRIARLVRSPVSIFLHLDKLHFYELLNQSLRWR